MIYKIHCEICNFTKVAKGEEAELHELKTSPIPVNAKKWDDIKNEMVKVDIRKQPKKLRCPKCGRAVIPKKVEDAQKTLENKVAEDERAKRIELEKALMIEQLKKEIQEKKKRLSDEKDRIDGGQAGPQRPTI